MKKTGRFWLVKIIALILFWHSVASSAQSFDIGDIFSGKRGVFALDPLYDGIIGTGGIVLTTTGLLMEEFLPPPKPEGGILALEKVNGFDRWAARPYSKALDISGTVTQAVAIAMPLAAMAAGTTELGVIAIMYAESVLCANGLKDILKTAVHRTRPYMYFEGAPEEHVKSGDFARSFPSGHSTLAFNGAVFASYVFCSYFPDSAWRIPVIAGSAVLAVGTAVQRMLSGNHFLTDVLAGAVIGSATGFLIPFAHKKLAEKERVSFSAVASGVAVRVRL